MSETTLISVRLESRLVEGLDLEAGRRSRPGARVTRTTLLNEAAAGLLGIDVEPSSLPPATELLEAAPQKPYKCPGVGCNMRSDSRAAVCPTHGRKVVPVG